MPLQKQHLKFSYPLSVVRHSFNRRRTRKTIVAKIIIRQTLPQTLDLKSTLRAKLTT